MKRLILGLMVIAMVVPVFATPIVIKEGRTLDRFVISDMDTTVATREYYGFLAQEGDWYILRKDTSNSTQPAIRYAGGKVSYEANWVSREALSYVRMNSN